MNGRTEIATEIGQIFADHQTSRYVGKIREVRQLAQDGMKEKSAEFRKAGEIYVKQ